MLRKQRIYYTQTHTLLLVACNLVQIRHWLVIAHSSCNESYWGRCFEGCSTRKGDFVKSQQQATSQQTPQKEWRHHLSDLQNFLAVNSVKVIHVIVWHVSHKLYRKMFKTGTSWVREKVTCPMCLCSVTMQFQILCNNSSSSFNQNH